MSRNPFGTDSLLQHDSFTSTDNSCRPAFKILRRMIGSREVTCSVPRLRRVIGFFRSDVLVPSILLPTGGPSYKESSHWHWLVWELFVCLCFSIVVDFTNRCTCTLQPRARD
jgi:hypothetical protein